jgi:hypothetical protein
MIFLLLREIFIFFGSLGEKIETISSLKGTLTIIL